MKLVTDTAIDLDSQTSAAPDPWAPENMILSQDFLDSGTEEILTRVSKERPSDQTYVRTHKTFHLSPVPILKLKDDLSSGHKRGETFFVRPSLNGALADFTKPCALYLLITRQRAVHIWPIPIAENDGRWNPAHETATRAVEIAKDRWVQIAWCGAERGYVPRASLSLFLIPFGGKA